MRKTRARMEEQGCQTRFESKRKLNVLMDQVARGRHDHVFTCMARHTLSANNLDLGCEGMQNVQKVVRVSGHIGFEQCLALDRAPNSGTGCWVEHPGIRTGI